MDDSQKKIAVLAGNGDRGDSRANYSKLPWYYNVVATVPNRNLHLRPASAREIRRATAKAIRMAAK